MRKIPEHIHTVLMMIFFISLVYDIRYLLTLCTIALSVNAFLHYRIEKKSWWNPKFFNRFTVGCLLYFAIQALTLFFTKNMHHGISKMLMNLGLVALPIAAGYSDTIRQRTWPYIWKGYQIILFSGTVYALIYAWIRYRNSHDSAVFFYHPLVKPLFGHAIQMSVLVFVALILLLENFIRNRALRDRTFSGLLLVYFTFFLVLLSSKLIITIFAMYLLYRVLFTAGIFSNATVRIASAVCVIASIIVVLITDNPLRRRFTEETRGGLVLLQRDKFTPGDYFTGTQFRLLSWRFVFEILNERRAWLMGVGMGDSQDILTQKYHEENMFTGGTPDNKYGYGEYHTHNQFLQALLESGVAGLLVFLLCCAGLVQMAMTYNNGCFRIFVFLMICYCFSDAVLKTQYGIILFVFFPLLLYETEKSHPAQSE